MRIDARLWNSVACNGTDVISIKQATIAMLLDEILMFFNIICILLLENRSNYQANSGFECGREMF